MHVLFPGTCEYGTLYSKTDFAGVIILGILFFKKIIYFGESASREGAEREGGTEDPKQALH